MYAVLVSGEIDVIVQLTAVNSNLCHKYVLKEWQTQH